MSLKFKFIPLTFIKDEDEIKKQIRNTIILKHFFEKNQKTVELKSLIDGTQYGYNASALQSGRNKFLRISDITDGKVDWNTVPYCDCHDEETYLLKSEDILIARTGGTTGKSFYITSPPEHSIYAGYLIRIRANKENNSLFINLLLNSYVYWSQIVSINEGEFRPSANAQILKNLLLPFCTFQEQKDAVNLSNLLCVEGYETLNEEINKAIAEYDRLKKVESEIIYQHEQAKLLRQSILQDAIQGKLTAEWREQNPDVELACELLRRIKKEKEKLVKEKKIKKEKLLPSINVEETPFDLPDSWAWCRLGEIVKHNAGKTLHKGQNTGQLRDYITTSNLYWGKFEVENINQIRIEDQELDRCTARKGDLLICEGGDVGRSAIWNKENNICFQNHIHRVRPYFSVDNRYIYFFMMYLYHNKTILNYKKGMGIGNLSGTALSSILISLPPYEEQRIIISKTEELLEKYNQLNNANQYLKN